MNDIYHNIYDMAEYISSNARGDRARAERVREGEDAEREAVPLRARPARRRGRRGRRADLGVAQRRARVSGRLTARCACSEAAHSS